VAWQLNIHTIDVGQGESSFIVAADPTTNQRRTMLIDGGKPGRATVVHAYLAALGLPVDHILTTHYDDDHSGGIQTLLQADNLWAICQTIGDIVDGQGYQGVREKDVATYTAACYAVLMGAYGTKQNVSKNVAQVARVAVTGGETDTQAADEALNQAQTYPYPALNARLVQPGTKANEVSRAVGLAAADVGGPAVDQDATGAAYMQMRTLALQGAKFRTEGLYHTSHIIDIGPTAHMPAKYAGSYSGVFYATSAYEATAPGLARTRTSFGPANAAPAALGTEILWGTGPNPVTPPPAGAPVAFLVAALKYAWKGGNKNPIASGEPDNDDSIGLVFRFNNFYFFTAGDLPSKGEDVIAATMKTQGFDRPGGGGQLPRADRIAMFKCGHHGASTATGDDFLRDSKARVAVISAGKNPKFEHPTEATLKRLADAKYPISHFYMTNCNFETPVVPASRQLDQRNPPQRSRIAGDNQQVNYQKGVARRRGDMISWVTEAASRRAANDAQRVINTQYWEEDLGPAGFTTETNTF
jgi:beta-lactamase superfamily II metal-dependent hydrolase